MKIALASPSFSESVNECLKKAERLTEQAALQGAEIICFPESYIPGYPSDETNVEKVTQQVLENALQNVCDMAANHSITIIMPMDWNFGKGLLNVAFVISSEGKLSGYQTKNQLDPSEDHIWIAGTERKIFEVNGVPFGITICHEGFRYPESVRWAAMNGAKIVFHPQFTGSDIKGSHLKEWGNKNNPYYEKAMMMRALENTIYFASVNYATNFQESATSLIAPDGTCIAHQPYGKEGVIVADIDAAKATALLAKRYKKELYS